MDETLHTFIAVGCMIGAYWWGKYSAGSSKEDLLASMLDKLEKGGFIATKTDSKGEKDLIPISEVIAKATRDAISTK
tara:strand:- start:358 stop:588 length:231 start_codon:yes stop_codon:yes gene_type:complete